MGIRQKPIYVCDQCNKEIDKPFIETSDVPYEGCSEIMCGKKTFDVGDQHYCSFECLVADIKGCLEL